MNKQHEIAYKDHIFLVSFQRIISLTSMICISILKYKNIVRKPLKSFAVIGDGKKKSGSCK